MIIDEILKTATDYKASDIHITVTVPPKVRVNGELVDMPFEALKHNDIVQLLTPIMNEKQKNALDTYGEVDFAYALPSVGRFRVNIFKQRGSLAATLRIIPPGVPDATKLGYPPSLLELGKKKRGIVLVTGPTGSGKSTTLASIIDYINSTYRKHIITLEDPIEYLHQHKRSIVNQREVGLDTNSFGNALRAALREDPDVILVGEMRDLETTQTAITAAETGHLVFATLHTIGAAQTIDRIIDQFPPAQQQYIRVQLALVLESVISQQLVPSVDGTRRHAAFEIMHATPAIRNLIREGKVFQITSYMQTNRKLGMQTLDDCLYQLYSDGKISGENCITFSTDPILMQTKVR